MSDLGALNLTWCRALLRGLIDAGVERVVISPGSRSTPLALAACRDARISHRVVLDERVAAFFALGAARASGRPVALIATSGSAVANWLPAVVEADLARVPLVLLSADRPPELVGWGANQTLMQPGLFGERVRLAASLATPVDDAPALNEVRQRGAQATAMARWPLPGPVHLNVPLREPLVPRNDPPAPEFAPLSIHPPASTCLPGDLDVIAEGIDGKGLIVCGPELGRVLPAQEIVDLAEAAACPILADPLSGLRCGGHKRGHVLTRYEAYLRSAEVRAGLRPDWVLRLGGMPVAKSVTSLLAELTGATQLVVDAQGRWPDPVHRSNALIQADPGMLCRALAEQVRPAAHEWQAAWATQEKRCRIYRKARLPLEARLVGKLVEALPDGATLVSGNSMPIRELDAFLDSCPRPLRLLANRGASGIDGNVATSLGVAWASEGPVVALLGDLALAHDIGALAVAEGMDATLIVIDNGGGGIFGYLPQASLPEHQALFRTPQPLGVGAAAAAYGLSYAGFDDPDALPGLLQTAWGREGVSLLRFVVDAEASRTAHLGYWAAAGKT